MFCGNCGKKISDTALFCPFCGEATEVKGNEAQSTASAPTPPPTPAPAPTPAPTPNPRMEQSTQGMNIPIRNYDPRWDYTPLGAWAYFLYSLLFALPLIGWIFAIVFAVGGTNRINLRNFARSMFCGMLVGIILACIVVAIVLPIAMANGGF